VPRPPLFNASLVDAVLANPFVIRWYMTNPFVNRTKLSGLLYGLQDERNDRRLRSYAARYEAYTINKTVGLSISNLGLGQGGGRRHASWGQPSKYAHVPSGARLEYGAYLDELARAMYALTPAGDRTDTFRHAEAVGLGVVPVMEESVQARLLASMVHEGSGIAAAFVTSWDRASLYRRFGRLSGVGDRQREVLRGADSARGPRAPVVLGAPETSRCCRGRVHGGAVRYE